MEKTFERNQICADMAGWESVEYIDSQSIVKNLKFNDKIVLQLASGKVWSRIDADSIAAAVKHELGGYDASVDVQHHGQGNSDGQQIYSLQQCMVLLRMTDYNGQQWLLGCKETPLRVSVEDSREADPTGTAAYTIHFTGKVMWPMMKV